MTDKKLNPEVGGLGGQKASSIPRVDEPSTHNRRKGPVDPQDLFTWVALIRDEISEARRVMPEQLLGQHGLDYEEACRILSKLDPKCRGGR